MKRLLFPTMFWLIACPMLFGQQVLSISPIGGVGAVIDQNGWRNFKLTITQTVTSFQFQGVPPPAQGSVTVILVENATGGFTVTFAPWTAPNGGPTINIANPCAVNTAANATTICLFEFDNTINTWTGISTGGGGGAGNPGGSANQLQFNLGGNAFGGIAGTTVTGSTIASTGLLDMSGGTFNLPVLGGCVSSVSDNACMDSTGGGIHFYNAQIPSDTFGLFSVPFNVSPPGTGILSSACAQFVGVNGLVGNAPCLPQSPIVNGSYACGFLVTSGAAVSPTCNLGGIPVDASNPTTLLYSHRANEIPFTGTTNTFTLPAISGNLASNFPFVSPNFGSGNVTTTSTSPNTIDGGAVGGSVTTLPNFARFFYQDSTPNWRTIYLPMFGAFPACADSAGNHINFTTAAGFTCGSTSSGGTPSFPLVVAGTVTSGGVPCFTSTTQESSSALLATNALVVGGGAGVCPGTGNGDFTYATHTLTGGASGLVDLSAIATTSGFKVPTGAGAVPTADGTVAQNSTNHTHVFGSNGTTLVVAAAATGTGSATTCTNQVITAISGIAAPTCSSVPLNVVVSPTSQPAPFTMTGDTLAFNWGSTNTNSFAFDSNGNPTFGLVSATTAITDSPTTTVQGSYENAATPTFAADNWTFKNHIGAGLNGTSTLLWNHSGTTGALAFDLSNAGANNVNLQVGPTSSSTALLNGFGVLQGSSGTNGDTVVRCFNASSNLIWQNSAGTTTEFRVNCSGQVTTLASKPSAGNGVTGEYYNTAATGQTAAIAATQMVANNGFTSDQNMEFTGYIGQLNAGTGCSGAATVGVNLIYTDPITGTQYTVVLPLVQSAATALATTVSLTNGALAVANTASWTYKFRVKASTVVQYSTSFTNGSGCSTQEAYNIYPVLRFD